jgi:hypothetical protein
VHGIAGLGEKKIEWTRGRGYDKRHVQGIPHKYRPPQRRMAQRADAAGEHHK